MKYRKSLSVILMVTSAFVYADTANYTATAPLIDGNVEHAIWSEGEWHELRHLMVGTQPEPEDFSGRYKLRWDEKAIYLLAQIQDDHLSDTYADPLVQYWNDDCLEIFIDADRSGGDHLNNYNAFAYHVALDNQVVDIGPDSQGNQVAQLYNDHVKSAWKRDTQAPYYIHWEAAIRVYADDYQQGANALPMKLHPGMKLGFMLAYCDADGGDREHFLGSHEITPVNGDKNLGYKDASVFGELTLTK